MAFSKAAFIVSNTADFTDEEVYDAARLILTTDDADMATVSLARSVTAALRTKLYEADMDAAIESIWRGKRCN
jgi:hypothetical protein